MRNMFCLLYEFFHHNTTGWKPVFVDDILGKLIPVGMIYLIGFK